MPGQKPNQAPRDVREKGAPIDGVPQVSNTRLYLQLLPYTGCKDTGPIIDALSASGLEAVLYQDISDPQGIAILVMSEEPNTFVNEMRTLLNGAACAGLTARPEMRMIGRTYSSGREPDLEDWLLHKPRRNARNPDWTWAIWYPLRRTGSFALLPPQDQGKILFEHAMIGRSYGEAGLAYDIRLASHGLDQNDNEFVIGLVGPELFPLSHIVQEMRKTQQTTQYIQSLGPFFVGKVCWQTPLT